MTTATCNTQTPTPTRYHMSPRQHATHKHQLLPATICLHDNMQHSNTNSYQVPYVSTTTCNTHQLLPGTVHHHKNMQHTTTTPARYHMSPQGHATHKDQHILGTICLHDNTPHSDIASHKSRHVHLNSKCHSFLMHRKTF